MRLAVALLPDMAAVTVAVVDVATVEVVTLNVPLDAPAAIVIEAGTVTAVLEEVKVMT